MAKLELNLKPDEKFNKTSKKIKVIPKKKYSVITQVTGFEGIPYSGYFVVIILNKKNQEITRLVQWLNDFSTTLKKINLTFQIPEDCSHVAFGYRINDEVPIKSACKFELFPLEQVTISEVSQNSKDNFSTPDEYSALEEDSTVSTSFKRLSEMNPKRTVKKLISKISGKVSLNLPRPSELTPKEELALERNIVWIFAFSRSGTQWLGTQLLSYKTNISSGPSIGLHLGSPYGGIENKFLRNIELSSKEPGYFFSDLYKNTWKYYIRKLILNRIHAQFQDLSKKIIAPDPEGSEGADILTDCLPQSKIVFLMRDGRDSVDSIMDAYGKKTWYTKMGLNPPLESGRLVTVKRISTRWVKRMEIIMNAYENHSENLRMKVKYEDLRNNTVNELEKIYDFIGINILKKDLKLLVDKFSFEKIPKNKRGTGKVTRSAQPGKWKENLSEEEKTTMQNIMGETLKKLRY